MGLGEERGKTVYLLNRLGLSLILALVVLPGKGFAHGTAEQHRNEMLMNTYVFIGAAVLFVTFIALYYMVSNKAKALENVKKPEERERRLQLARTAKKLKWAWVTSLIGVVVSGGMALVGNSAGEVKIKHVHGIGYSTDGERILIPIHDGLIAYSNGQWSEPEGEKHDYMGFSPVDDGFYSSGHPAEGSGIANPLGIIKSTDEGKTLETLDLAGEMDFHGMAAGYQNHAIYVFNTRPNSKMKSPGMYYTKDEAQTWTQSQLQGLNDQPSALAVHPTNDAIVALGSSNGVYLSNDNGDNFENVLPGKAVTSLFFNNKGQLLVADYNDKSAIVVYDVEIQQSETIPLPELQAEEVVGYMAQHPTDMNEVTLITANQGLYNIYLTKDKGQSWKLIVEKNVGITESAE